LVAVVSSRERAEVALRAWAAVREEPIVRQSGMQIVLCSFGEDHLLERTPADVVVTRVRNSDEFSTRTGIRFLPFSLIIARGHSVLAAGTGVPDASFVLDAATRFVRKGSSAATVFRRMSAETSRGLTPIEPRLGSRTAIQ
jgi:hypothetical protein